MKKLGLVAILIAGSMFAASISDSSDAELYSMIKNADAKTLSDVSFEMHKRAGKYNAKARDMRNGFRDEMQKRVSDMSDEDRAKFMQEYRKNMQEKMDLLTVKEARDMGFGHMGGKNKHGKGACKNMGSKNCGKMPGKGMMNQDMQGSCMMDMRAGMNPDCPMKNKENNEIQ